ncbi:MAG: hypothetical protein K2L82_11945 [Lachnospiraceae bacterium]|nr:hypothetical protein [Lachnospiraceae bacterium]
MVFTLDSVIQKETRNKIVCVMLAICSVAAIGINFENIPEMKGLYAVLASLHGWGLGQAVFVICLAYFYYYIRHHFPVQKDIAVFSLFLSVLVLIGLCYRNATGFALCMLNAAQIMKTMIVLTGYGTLLYCLVLLLYQWMSDLAGKHVGHRQTGSGIKDRYRLKTGLFLFICWLPYLIAFYPGSALYDAGTMLEQWYGYEPLTNHHPYFQILFLVLFVKIGVAIGSAAAGMFFYVLVQVAAFIMVLSYMADFLRKLGISVYVLRGLICLYAFLPIFPVYAISVGKNINFAIAALLVTIFMFETALSPDEFVQSRIKMVLLPILLVLLCLFRNEGLAITVGCIPCFLILGRKHWKVLGAVFAGVLVFVAFWFKIFLPMSGVPNGSIAESLSIPFLQTARCVASYGHEMPEEEKEAIDNILVYDTLAERYLPEFSDRVKDQYNNDATKEDWEAYLKVYFKQFMEHPVTYLDAVLNKCYGYVYPDDPGRTKAYYVVGADVFRLNADGFDLKSRFPVLVEGMNQFMTYFRGIPFLGYTTSIGLYFWCAFVFAFFLIRHRRWKMLTLYVQVVITLLVCVASPVNAYFRYGLSVVFAVPFLFFVTLYAFKEEKLSDSGEMKTE